MLDAISVGYRSIDTAPTMTRIEAPDGGESLFFSHYDPQTVEWILSMV